MNKSWIILALALTLILPISSQAHMIWLLTDQDVVQVKQPVKIEIGWGHKFPKDEEIKAERLGAVKAVGPEGREVALKKISSSQYELVPPATGVYLISAQLVPGFATRTPQGMKMQSKKGVPDANYCFRFDMAAKTLVNVGNAQPGAERLVQSSLEIVPLKNPVAVKVGDTLPVRVMFQGKPQAGVKVEYTHENWADPQKPLATLGQTNDQGEIQVKVDQPGQWLLLASHKTPYAEPEECDDNFYRATLTWRVR
ncbi:MAG: hypothetical protein BZ151_01680 [Desulfobacca sp. 4484_104]|nr:MAG: hypothetical protein BZ151_01680 [Desulfobacca sp. 4484_104]